MNNIKYFDHAATTGVSKEVFKEMLPFFSTEYGNPSSIYGVGRRAKRAIEEAREKVAKAINAHPKEIYFTGCGSESDNIAIKGIARANRVKGNHIITSKIEHHAVLNSCKTLEQEGFNVTYLNVDKNGRILLKELENAITQNTILITIMTANNEIGIIFHTDSVQAIGNIRIDVQKMNIDSLSMSAHKFYGPKGVGALYVREGIEFQKLQDGGHQEKDKRAGTENTAGIVGLGKAIDIAYKTIDNYNEHLQSLRDYYISGVENEIPDAMLNGDRSNRLPGNANFSFKGVDGGDLLLKLDENGICASTGSACNTGSTAPSHVLVAIGTEMEYLQGSLRITFGKESTKEDVDYLVNNLKQIVKECRK